MTAQEIETLALRPEERIVFHGTNGTFQAFDEAFIGTGPDRNSELGFHFADMPLEAEDYRRGGRLLVVGAITENPIVEPDYYSFFGYDEAGNDVAGKGHFSARRKQMLAQGHDAIEYEDGEQTICVVLKPDAIRILAELSADEAVRLHQAISDLADANDEARLEALKDVLRARNLAPPRP